MTTAELCDFLSRFVDRPVLDTTGLTAAYQVTMDLPLDQFMKAAKAGESVTLQPNGPDSAADPSGNSAIFSAIQVLGLKLEPRKAPVDILIVDRAEKVPVEN